MIARVWTARTSPARVSAYAEYLQTHVFPELRAIEGYERALLLQREFAGYVEVQVMTFWRSLEAIRAFAGADIEAAVVTDRAATLLDDYDRRARHYDVLLIDGPHQGTRQ